MREPVAILWGELRVVVLNGDSVHTKRKRPSRVALLVLRQACWYGLVQ